MASAGRIKKEIGVICKPDSTSGVIAAVASDDQRVPGKPGWRHLVGTITGPEGTAYEGGVFDVDILIPTEYPFEPPKMKFITKIWHPNVSSQTGAICLVSWCCEVANLQYVMCLSVVAHPMVHQTATLRGFGSYIWTIYMMKLTGHPERPMVAGAHNQNRNVEPSGPALLAGTHRSAGRTGGADVS